MAKMAPKGTLRGEAQRMQREIERLEKMPRATVTWPATKDRKHTVLEVVITGTHDRNPEYLNFQVWPNFGCAGSAHRDNVRMH